MNAGQDKLNAPNLTIIPMAAQAYTSIGLRVMILHRATNTRPVPSCTCWEKSACDSVGKHPRLKNWQKKATSDAEIVDQWFKDWPSSNVGIVTGEDSGVVCLDIDLKTVERTRYVLSRRHMVRSRLLGSKAPEAAGDT
jgi:hypothetical protein